MNEFEKEANIPPEELIQERALACVEQGWAVFPVATNAKTPLTKNGFKDASKSPDAVRKTFAKHKNPNIGLATGEVSGVAVIDVDIKKGAKGRESLGQLKGLPPTLTVTTPSGGWHLYYLHPEGGLRSKNGILPGIDLKADGGYVLAAGSSIDGKPYEYQDPEASISALPPDILEQLRNSIGKSRKASEPVSAAIAEGNRNAKLASLAGTLRRKGLGQGEIAVALKAVNAQRCDPPLAEVEVDGIAASIARYPQNGAARPSLNEINGEDADEVLPVGFTEDALAVDFTTQHAENWKFVAAWGHWLCWDGVRWVKEITLRAFDQARLVCREAASRCQKAKIAAKLSSAATVAAVERMAKADRRHAATIEQWDADPWLLNTPGNVVDVRTGQARGNSREDYATKITLGRWESSAHKPELWLTFLNEVTAGDTELQGYLARVAGYALTGVTTEHALFFFYGTGANGKSVFLNTLAAVMGDYATNAPISTFLESKSEQHPTDLAGLRGARLVTAIEVEKGRRWAESKIKSLTGGDKISARFMRQDFFEYVPQFKLLIAGNNKPAIRDVDEAMRRRMHLIPFEVTIPPHRRDHGLAQKLLAEKDGILRWAIDGCLEWQRVGLKPPARVVSATEEYLEAEDALGRWLEECCDRNPSATTTTNELFGSWKTWSERGGEYTGTLRKFSEDVAKRGFARWKSNSQKGFRGIALKGQEVQEPML